jgi:hypothetical protein
VGVKIFAFGANRGGDSGIAEGEGVFYKISAHATSRQSQAL